MDRDTLGIVVALLIFIIGTIDTCQLLAPARPRLTGEAACMSRTWPATRGERMRIIAGFIPPPRDPALRLRRWVIVAPVLLASGAAAVAWVVG